MSSSTIDRSRKYRTVIYARMSSDRQNERSPDQQIDQIHACLRRNGLNWIIARNYVDSGISGRTERDRPNYQTMMRDIRARRQPFDFILVDSISRFGRHDRISDIRRELKSRYGVQILTADSNFEDPNTDSGIVSTVFRELSAHTDNRNKARDVSRGKADAVRQGLWPGGPAPFGLRLQMTPSSDGGRRRGQRSQLVVVDSEAFVLRQLFERAAQTGVGTPSLARFLNNHPDIDPALKPFHNTTIDNWLSNRIYTGVYVYKKFKVDIVDDVRVRKRYDDDELIVQENFCEPIVDQGLFREVNALRQRRKRPRADVDSRTDSKLIQPELPPTSVKYFLSGLVRCDHCGACMTPTSRTEEGRNRRAYYRCPRHMGHTCCNSRHVPIDWLDRITLDAMKQWLFGAPTASAMGASDDASSQSHSRADASWTNNSTIKALIAEVRHVLELRQQPGLSPIPHLQKEIHDLDELTNGWVLSLGRTQISHEVRQTLEKNLEDALSRKQVLLDRIQELQSISKTIDIACDPDIVIDRLERLHDVIANGNASRMNLELSLHIDCIRCREDGNVTLRTCQLGAFNEALNVLRCEGTTAEDSLSPTVEYRVRPRRRAPLRLYGEADYDDVLRDLAAFAADPHRFSGINEHWFDEMTFSIPVQLGWAEKNALIVAEKRKQGLTEHAIAVEQNVSLPTVRKALKIAKKTDPELALLPRKMPRARWDETHADEVFHRKQVGESLEALAREYKRCDETVRKAFILGRKRAEEKNSAL